MNIELSYLLGPAVGALVGYITNDVAIRLMFKPTHPKYVFGMRIPFTPGLIPKERGRIAEAVGTSITGLINPNKVMPFHSYAFNIYRMKDTFIIQIIFKIKARF